MTQTGQWLASHPQRHMTFKATQFRHSAAFPNLFRSFFKIILLISVWWSHVVFAAGESEAPQPPPHFFKESCLAQLPLAGQLLELRISPDNAHIAYSYYFGTNVTAWLDGVQLGSYDDAGNFVFSPDGRHLAYICRRGWDYSLVRDCQEGAKYTDIGKGCVFFSGDSQHLAYLARRGSKWIAVHDTKEGKGYDRIGKAVVLSHDGSRLAYPVIEKKEDFTVVDGEEGVRCDGLGSFHFSPDGKHYGYVVPLREKWLVVLDGKAEQYSEVLSNGVIFSRDSKKSIYAAAEEAGRFRVYLNGAKSKEFESIGTSLLAISPDSQRVAYGGKREGKWRVMIDEKETPAYDGIMAESLVFSPDSAHVAFAFQRGTQWFVALDGKESKAYEGIGAGSVVFSPDSKHLAFVAGRNGKFMAVLDDAEGQPYSDIGAHDLLFSHDSRHFAYVARQTKGWLVVVDEKPGKEYESIALRPFSFAPNDHSLAFVASEGEKYFFVVDGKESKRYEQFLYSPQAGNAFKSLQLVATTNDAVFGRRLVCVEASGR